MDWGARVNWPLPERAGGEAVSPEGNTAQLEQRDAGTFKEAGEDNGDFATRDQKALGKCWGTGNWVRQGTGFMELVT